MSEASYSPFETEPKAFDWRDRFRDTSGIDPKAAQKLDELTDLVNQEGPEGEFLKNLGHYRKPALSLVQHFRDILTPEERTELFDALEKAAK